MDNIKLGQKVFLQPIISDTESICSTRRKLNLKNFSRNNKQKFNRDHKILLDRKKIAQELYYSQNPINNAFKKPNAPVHTRLGGAEYKRKGFKAIWGINQETFVKPRIKRGANGIMTAKYYEKAQNRLRMLQKQIYYPHDLQIQFRNNGTRQPLHFHSLKNSLDKNVQAEILLLQQTVQSSQEVDTDEPYYIKDSTGISIHERFCSYP